MMRRSNRLASIFAVAFAVLACGCSTSSSNDCNDSVTRPDPYTMQAPLPASCLDAGDAGACEPICQLACPQPNSSEQQLRTCDVVENDAGTGEVLACSYAPYPIDPTPCD
jgi:hypothetical protein